MKAREANKTIILILRSIYIKGLSDGNIKRSDMSWEPKVLSQLKAMLLEEMPKEKQGITYHSHRNPPVSPIDKGKLEYNRCIAEMREVILKLFN